MGTAFERESIPVDLRFKSVCSACPEIATTRDVLAGLTKEIDFELACKLLAAETVVSLHQHERQAQ